MTFIRCTCTAAALPSTEIGAAHKWNPFVEKLCPCNCLNNNTVSDEYKARFTIICCIAPSRRAALPRREDRIHFYLRGRTPTGQYDIL